MGERGLAVSYGLSGHLCCAQAGASLIRVQAGLSLKSP